MITLNIIRKTIQITGSSLVAGALSLLVMAGSEPPDWRIEPENRLNDRVNRRGQIVLSADVVDLMGKDGVKLGVAQPLSESHRPDDSGLEHADDAGLARGLRESQPHTIAN